MVVKCTRCLKESPVMESHGGDCVWVEPHDCRVCPECGAAWDTEHNRCTANPEHCT
jgi:hypothetical protein